jgi:hypothetical protein
MMQKLTQVKINEIMATMRMTRKMKMKVSPRVAMMRIPGKGARGRGRVIRPPRLLGKREVKFFIV